MNAPSIWGRCVAAKTVGSRPVTVFTPRPRALIDILDHAARWGERGFLVCGRRRVSFSAFRRAVDAAAAALAARGVNPGDVVLLLAANSPEWLVAFWALARRRAVIALGNAWWSAEEIADACGLTGPAMILADAPRRARLGCDAPAHELEALAAAWDDPGSRQHGRGAGPDPIPARGAGAQDGDEEDPAMLVFTSGTTSRAKAAVISHRAAIACLQTVYAGRDAMPDGIPPDAPQLHFLCCAPLFHISGYMAHTQALLSGHKFVLLDGRADPARIIDLIREEEVHLWATVPTLLARVARHPDARAQSLASVTAVAAGGAMVTPQLMEDVRAAFPNVRLGAAATYGLTESGGSVTAISGEEYLARPHSSGRALPGCAIRIHSPDASGEGEILVRSPAMMSGYWGQCESPVDAQGWLHTGDLGRLDAEGYLAITGRSKDIIIRGGENVSSPRVEACIARHGDVLEAAVIGLDHPDLGEEVAAIVVARPGATPSEEDLRAFLRESLAYFEIPSRWWIRTEPLATTSTVKVQKMMLRREWLARSAGAP